MSRKRLIYPDSAFKAGSTARVRGLAAWSPHYKTRNILDQVRNILTEYADYLPLTLRQIFYRLLGAYGFPKTEDEYKSLGEYLNRARRSGRIPWEAIRDDGITLLGSDHRFDAPDMMRYLMRRAGAFRLDRQDGQETRIMFLVEASGMAPLVSKIADPYGIQVHSCGGFDSTTAKYILATDMCNWSSIEVLHIGDHDPSGVHVFNSASEDITQLAHDIARKDEADKPEIEFTRLAVTQLQMVELNLPTSPAKKGDKRKFAGRTTQCEAIPPDIFASIIQDAIEERLDHEVYEHLLTREDAIRQRLTDRLEPVLKASLTELPAWREIAAPSRKRLPPTRKRLPSGPNNGGA